MEFEDASGIEPKKKGPHPDAERNYCYYKALLAKCILKEELQCGIHEITEGKSSKEVNAIQFCHGPIGNRDGCFVVNCHQDSQKFKADLCDVLNFLYSKELLDRVDR